jgi:PAS domain S-box-containing protein
MDLVLIEDMTINEDDLLYNEGCRSMLCMPVRIEGRVRWLLSLGSRDRDFFLDRDMHRLSYVLSNVELVLGRLFLSRIDRYLADNVSDAIVIVDSEGLIVGVNRSAEEMLKLRVTEARGRRINDFLSTFRRDEVSGARSLVRKHYVCSSSGERKKIVVTKMRLPGEFGYVVLFCRKI